MKKRGISHIEVIISFVIFITFVLALFYFFNPIKESKLLESSAKYAQSGLKNNLTTDLMIYSIQSDRTKNSIGVKIESVNEEYNLRAEKISGDLLQSSKSNAPNVYNVENQGESFFIMLFSDDFSISTEGITASHNPNDYNVSSSLEDKAISEKRASALKSAYENNYDELKAKLNIPSSTDFGFRIKMSGSEIIASKNIPSGLEIATKSERIKVIRSNGKIEFADMVVSVW